MTSSSTTISRRFQVAATALALALLLPAVSGWWSTRALARRADRAIQQAVTAQQLSARFVTVAMEVAHSGQSYVSVPSASLEAEFRAKGQEAHDIAQQIRRDAAESGETASAVASLDRQLSELESHLIRAHRHIDLGETEGARNELAISVPFHEEMLRAVNRLGVAEAAHLSDATEGMRNSTRYQGLVFFIVFGIAAIVGVFITRWLSQTVARPLTRLVAHASAIANRDHDAHTPVASVPGEFGALAVAMNEASASLVRVEKAEAVANAHQRLAMVGRLASGVAHELNNPLHTILLTVGLLQEDASDPTLRKELDVVRAQAARAREIVRDLMATARPSVGLQETVPADSIVRRAEDELQRLAAMHRAYLVIELPSASLSPIEGNREDLTRVLGILVSNAAYAVGDGGVVTLRADECQDACRFIVEDNGPGLPGDVVARLFEPFFSTKPVGEGSGLGLTVALGIVESHHGSIVAENRTDRTGARFIVRIPSVHQGVATKTPASVPVSVPVQAAVHVESRRRRTPLEVMATLEEAGEFAHAANPHLDGKGHAAPRVLIVDDEPTVRSVLSRILARAGWHFDEARDGAAALALIDSAERAQQRYDLILCDLRMPTMSGIALHDTLAQKHPSLLKQMTITSGDLASPDIVAFLGRTACRVMEKPLDMKEVLRVAAMSKTNLSPFRVNAIS